MQTFKDRLRWCFTDYVQRTGEKLTRQALGDSIGVTRGAVQLWVAGDTKDLKAHHYAALARVFDVRRDWLETGRGVAREGEWSSSPQATNVAMAREDLPDYAAALRPLLAWEHTDELPPGDLVAIPRMAVRLGAGPGKEQPEFELVKDRPQIFAADWIRRMNLKPDALRVMYADGNSMEPRIYDSDALVVDLSQTSLVDGAVYALHYDDGERVKRLSRRPGGGLVIASDNPDHPTISLTAEEAREVRILGRVVNTSGHRGL